tara:strand:+ start:322 stop:501 length:180 start_codon:yes stop_codon:yes gene_type:complete
MKNDHDRLKTASRLKNWIACNYTTVNEINNKELKKKIALRQKLLEKKEEMSLKPKFIKI